MADQNTGRMSERASERATKPAKRANEPASNGKALARQQYVIVSFEGKNVVLSFDGNALGAVGDDADDDGN